MRRHGARAPTALPVPPTAAHPASSGHKQSHTAAAREVPRRRWRRRRPPLPPKASPRKATACCPALLTRPPGITGIHIAAQQNRPGEGRRPVSGSAHSGAKAAQALQRRQQALRQLRAAGQQRVLKARRAACATWRQVLPAVCPRAQPALHDVATSTLPHTSTHSSAPMGAVHLSHHSAQSSYTHPPPAWQANANVLLRSHR